MSKPLRPHQLTILLVTTLLLFVSACGDEGPATTPNQDNKNDETELPPAFEAHFTQPEPGEDDDTISQTVIDLLDMTPEGATVRAAMYTFSREPVAEAFGDAVERGVDVEMVLGNLSTHYDGSDWTAVELLRDLLGDRLYICRDGEDEGGCIGERIQHNKFITFSELEDGSEHVVVQTSANLTHAQLQEIDNLVVLRYDTALYDAYRSYWKDLRAAQPDPEYNRVEVGDNSTRVYFFPHSNGDPIVDNLQKVDCESGADVYLAMAFFTNARRDVASELRALDEQGCSVHAVLRQDQHTGSPGAQVESDLRRGNIDFALFTYDAPINLHSKYLLVDGAFGPDSEHQSIVWTGSHNYTLSALRYNDETILEIRDRDLFEDFLDDWQQIRDRAQTVN